MALKQPQRRFFLVFFFFIWVIAQLVADMAGKSQLGGIWGQDAKRASVSQ